MKTQDDVNNKILKDKSPVEPIGNNTKYRRVKAPILTSILKVACGY